MDKACITKIPWPEGNSSMRCRKYLQRLISSKHSVLIVLDRNSSHKPPWIGCRLTTQIDTVDGVKSETSSTRRALSREPDEGTGWTLLTKFRIKWGSYGYVGAEMSEAHALNHLQQHRGTCSFTGLLSVVTATVKNAPRFTVRRHGH